MARLTRESTGLQRLVKVAVVVQQLLRQTTALEVLFSQRCGPGKLEGLKASMFTLSRLSELPDVFESRIGH